MDLKGILKTLKLNEGTISTLLGVLVVLVVGFLIISYFRGLKTNINPQVTSTSTENIPGGKHTVAQGESLWQISEKYYGSGYNWTDIANENKLTEPGKIEVGQVLSIPAVEDKTVAQAEPAPVKVVVPSPSPASPQDSIQSGSEYTIVKGDHLWGIAVRTYGDGYQWTKIWRANKIQNPDLIYPDQKLTLPKL